MYIDFLIKIKNAQAARKEFLKVSYTNMDMAIAELLVKNGYLEAALKKGRMPKRVIEVKLKYKDGKGAIDDMKFISRPSQKVMSGYREFRAVRQDYGMAVVSTSEGILTMKEARRAKVGGQILFEIW
jgi:small subunit ribosomal protein S8